MSTQTAQRMDDTRAWMANRYREVDGRGRDAEAAGHAAYGRAARTGVPFSAPRPSDVITVGARRLAAPRPTPSDDFNEFRRQQAEFTKLQHEEQRRNAWLAVPALAPVAVAMGLEGLGWGASRALGRAAWQNPKGSPPDLPAGQALKPVASAIKNVENSLSEEAKNALRAAARSRFERANGISASRMNAEIHHSDPLEFSYLKPKADPNRLANLWALRPEAHAIASREWAAFRAALRGRIPSQAEVMAAKMRIDRTVEPYIRRAGVPRSNVPPRKGGPL